MKLTTSLPRSVQEMGLREGQLTSHLFSIMEPGVMDEVSPAQPFKWEGPLIHPTAHQMRNMNLNPWGNHGPRNPFRAGRKSVKSDYSWSSTSNMGTLVLLPETVELVNMSFQESTIEKLKADVILVSASTLQKEIEEVKAEIAKQRELIDLQVSTDEEYKLKLNEKIESVSNKLSNVDVILNWFNLAKSQSVWKAKTCRHNDGRVCRAWNVSDPESVGIPPSYLEESDGVKRISTLKFPLICLSCPLHEVR